jgi:hypothetical protein
MNGGREDLVVEKNCAVAFWAPVGAGWRPTPPPSTSFSAGVTPGAGLEEVHMI